MDRKIFVAKLLRNVVVGMILGELVLIGFLLGDRAESVNVMVWARVLAMAGAIAGAWLHCSPNSPPE